MDEEFDTSFDTSDTDFSSDIDTTDVDYDTSSDLDMDDVSYDTLDDISDDVSDFGTESEDYDTLDDISDIESDEMDYDTLDDICDDMPESEFEESNFENVTDEASEDVPEADLTEETSDVETDVGDNMDEIYSDDEYETLEDVPDETTIVEEDEDSDIETLDDVQEDEFVAEEEKPEYETLDDIPDNEDETIVDEQEIETLDDITNDMPTDDFTESEDGENPEITDNNNADDSLEAVETEGNDTSESIEPPESDLTEMSPDEITSELDDAVESDNTLDDLEDVNLTSDSNVETNYDEPSEYSEDDPPKTLTREITPEVLESRNRDTEETLENYRENLRGHGVDEDKIEEFINQERDKINAEYESLDNGDTSSNIYHQPTNWEDVADSLMAESTTTYETPIAEGQDDLPIAEGEISQNDVFDDNIDYDGISADIESDALSEGFKDINIDQDSERLNSSLVNFDSNNWENLSLSEQKESMGNLADYVSDVLSLENPPTIEYYNNPVDGDYGGYNPATNSLQINEHMLYDSDEAADTIAHELWHAHQHECASNPQNALHYQYQHGFDNYISPDLDPVGYQNQLVEAEARAFAEQFKDRLNSLKGGQH